MIWPEHRVVVISGYLCLIVALLSMVQLLVLESRQCPDFQSQMVTKTVRSW